MKRNLSPQSVKPLPLMPTQDTPRHDSPMQSAAARPRAGLRIIKNVVSFAFKAVVVAYFIFAVLFLSLRYGLLPNVDHFKPYIEQLASKAVGNRVTIGTIGASWRGLQPHLNLRNVAVHDASDKPALALPEVAATVSWWSVPALNLRLDRLELTGPDLHIRRDAQGKLFVGGIAINPDARGDGKGADWILSQHNIVIRNGRLHWVDEQRGAPELALANVTVLLRNRWTHHQIALKATPSDAYASPVDVRADFHHSPFTSRISDVSRWSGQIYADLRQADLAIWNAFVDYPIELTRGAGSLRAWLEFDQANLVDVTADVALDDVRLRLQDDLPALILAQVDGRISASEAGANAGAFSFGDHGHQVTLTDFSLRTEDGVSLPSMTIAERFMPATKVAPATTEVSASALELEALAALASHLPLPPEFRSMLDDMAPRGLVRDVSLRWQGEPAAMSAYRAKGTFQDVTVKARSPLAERLAKGQVPARTARAATPGFQNLSGTFDVANDGGRIALASGKTTLELPGLLQNPKLPLEGIEVRAHWSFPAGGELLASIDRMTVRQQGSTASLSGTLRMPLDQANGVSSGVVDLAGGLDRVDVQQISRYLPLRMSPELRGWLAGALRGGTVRDIAWKIQGKLADFPFHASSTSGKPDGVFRVTGKIGHGIFDFDPKEARRDDATTPFWPIIEQIDGRFAWNRTQLDIVADRAVTHDIALSKAQVSLTDLLSDERMAVIDVVAAAPLQQMITYVDVTPISGWIGNFLDQTSATGPARLALQARLPFSNLRSSKVDGTLQLADNKVALMETVPPLSGATGKVTFSEKGFQLVDIQADFLGGPVTFSGGSRSDGTILVTGEGTVTAEGLRADYPDPAMQRLLGRVNGSTRYTTSIKVKDRRPEILVRSDMQGIAIDFPAPLNKLADSALPLDFQLSARASTDPRITRDEIRLALGTSIEARYQREKRAGTSAPWRVASGGIGVNEPAPQPDSGLIASVNMPTLNIDEWRAAVSSIVDDPASSAGKSVSSEPLNTIAAITAKEEASTPMQTTREEKRPGQNGLAQYIEPQLLAARASELFILGKKLDNVVVGASRENNVWQANIDSAQASGYVTWAESRSGTSLGRIKARLARLIIPESTASDVADLLQDKSETMRIPELDIVAEDFQLFGKRFGELKVSASNVRGKRGSEWRIDELLITNPDATLLANGRWQAGEPVSTSGLTYALDIEDAGRLLERLGFAGVLRGGKGKLDGILNWNGMPFSFDIPTLSGVINLTMQSGQFLKVEPGAAKLLGVLSLQSLPRRLALDFRDVFSEGFAFDGIVGTVAIERGTALTDNFKMRSVNATVLMDGTADIVNETQNLHVAVIPEINAGTASIVYGLAINPIVGVGTFLAQLFLRDPLSRAFTFEYQITGPWKDPTVAKMPRSGNATDEKLPENDPIYRKTG
jgi:uncharacterized protein (TIGR02099 family)